MHIRESTNTHGIAIMSRDKSICFYFNLFFSLAILFKPGMPACGRYMPGFLKLFLYRCLYVCVFVCLCVSAPKAINN